VDLSGPHGDFSAAAQRNLVDLSGPHGDFSAAQRNLVDLSGPRGDVDGDVVAARRNLGDWNGPVARTHRDDGETVDDAPCDVLTPLHLRVSALQPPSALLPAQSCCVDGCFLCCLTCCSCGCSVIRHPHGVSFGAYVDGPCHLRSHARGFPGFPVLLAPGLQPSHFLCLSPLLELSLKQYHLAAKAPLFPSKICSAPFAAGVEFRHPPLAHGD